MEQHELGTIRDLVLYRLDTAEVDIRSAQALMDIGDYRGANNRAYYAIFHAICAIHALDGNSYRRHKDAIANFNKNYVKTEIFPREMGRRISQAEEIRHASDYDDFYIAGRDEADSQIQTAIEFTDMVRQWCNDHLEQCIE